MREIRLYGSEGGGMSNHLSLPLSGLKPQKHVFSHTPSCGRGRAMSASGRRSPPPATLTLGRKDIKEFVGATRGRPNSQ